ncbi:hypothetical protein FRX31_021590, partial [Thalictrum thalictroides]
MFGDGITCKLGNGNRIRFWYDKWAGTSSLDSQFPRLLSLSTRKNGTVREMCHTDSESGHWLLHFRRALRDWELPMLENLLSRIGGSSFSEEDDSWSW